LVTIGIAFLIGSFAQPLMMRRLLYKPRFDSAFSEHAVEFSPEEYRYEDEEGIDSSIPSTASSREPDP